MNNFFVIDGWNEHFHKMENLENAKGDSLFAVMNYVAPMPCCEQVVIISHGNSLAELAGYLRYRVVRDMIWVVQKNPDFEPEDLNDERIAALTPEQKEKAAEPIRFWRLLGECFQKENWEEDFREILIEFSNTFPLLDYCTYSFNVYENADELREHLIKCYGRYDEDAVEVLKNSCASNNFDSNGLIEFCEEVFGYDGDCYE